MEASTLDIVDLVETTVIELGGEAQDVSYGGVGIVLIKGKPISAAKIKACTHSAKEFVALIEGML